MHCCIVSALCVFSACIVTRGHPLKLQKPGLRKALSVRYNFFTNRIINVWNQLPEDVVLSKTVSNFKFKISKLDFSALVDYSK